MAEDLYFQSIVQYRVKVNDDGTIGNPEIMKKFTTPVKGAQTYNKPKKAPKKVVELKGGKTEEEFI